MLDSGEPLELFDVRPEAERDLAKIAAARPFDDEGRRRFGALAKDAKIVFHCHHGMRSRAAAEEALRAGLPERLQSRGRNRRVVGSGRPFRAPVLTTTTGNRGKMSSHPTNFQGDVLAAIREAIANEIEAAEIDVSGGGGHYSIVVVARAFEGKSMLESQRLVYAAIAHLMKGDAAPVHAVDSLKTKPL